MYCIIFSVFWFIFRKCLIIFSALLITFLIILRLYLLTLLVSKNCNITTPQMPNQIHFLKSWMLWKVNYSTIFSLDENQYFIVNLCSFTEKKSKNHPCFHFVNYNYSSFKILYLNSTFSTSGQCQCRNGDTRGS